MIGSIIRAMSKQIHDMQGIIVFVPVITNEHVTDAVDRSLAWADSISYVLLRGFLLYCAIHYALKYW